NTADGDGCNGMCKKEGVVLGEGALEVSLNDDTAPSSTIPQRA
ncbi:unnamed protein product, partial [marine sediment metagenome]